MGASLGGATAKTQPEFGQSHLHGCAMLAFAHRFAFGQSLGLVWRAGRPEAALGEVVCGCGAAEIGFGGVLFRFAEQEVARGEVSVDLERGFVLAS